MKTPAFPPPSARDPKLCMVGMPTRSITGTSTHPMMEWLAVNRIDGWKFLPVRMGGAGVAKARNTLTHIARLLGASQVIFMDADVTAGPDHFRRLLSHDVELVAAACPKQQLDCFKVVGEFLGEAALPSGLVRMVSLGTPFIRFSMALIDQIAAMPAAAYESDERIEIPTLDGSPPIIIEAGDEMRDFWPMGVIEKDWFDRGRVYPRYVTEDYYFSHYASLVGVKPWLDMQCQVGHIGPVDYLEVHRLLQAHVAKAQAQQDTY